MRSETLCLKKKKLPNLKERGIKMLEKEVK
jgi:hypothetical protein